MKVVDHEPAFWFLLSEGGRLLLDVNCESGFLSYDVVIELDAAEMAEYAARGHGYLSGLAEEINYSAPGLRVSKSPYKDRNLANRIGSQVAETINEWHRQQKQ